MTTPARGRRREPRGATSGRRPRGRPPEARRRRQPRREGEKAGRREGRAGLQSTAVLRLAHATPGPGAHCRPAAFPGGVEARRSCSCSAEQSRCIVCNANCAWNCLV